MPSFYLEIRAYGGWWNDQGRENFSPQDFLILVLGLELKGFPSLSELLANPNSKKGLEDLAHSIAHGLGMNAISGSDYTFNGVSNNTIFNYAGAQQLIRERYSAYKRGKNLMDTFDQQVMAVEQATYVIKKALDPSDPEWKNGGTYSNPIPADHPCYWGNQSMLPGINPIWSWGGGNSFGVWSCGAGR